ncbi:N-acetyl-gamma-glutamyl-phosphate reductase [Pseudalkalibacillus decolorationis]|uniref:N-acetyl-gamma-glutamyl-phosphate reductase n=1 Tax=Pseudalkalibacillus decolorationis TaxID=163879 RepID=UPI002148EC03|nr:N-acetyl-gamma-glutamyl-phosphate reductase [Pseudalkalibacillus decolorationis]
MKVAIVGGSGYSAVELIRLLHNHPLVEIEALISHSKNGSEFQTIYPHLTNLVELVLEELDVPNLSKKVEVVFFATPAGISKELVPQFKENGVKCIDLSGDFRLKSPEDYETWYKQSAPEQQYLNEAIYGLSEIYEEKIENASLIANPGCYPTATLLALLPVIKHGLVDTNSIIVDAKSGVSGAGRGLSLGAHYAEINENMKAYKLGSHQHIPEIEQVLGQENGEDITITFSSHLVPMSRGILCTAYMKLTSDQTTEEIIQLYKNFYESHPFVRIRPEGILPSTKEVYGSNYCDLGFYVDQRTGRLTIVSVIDNLVKGAAGQAIQNLNLMYGWDIQTGLTNVPIYP